MTRKDYEAIAAEFKDQAASIRVFLEHNGHDHGCIMQLATVEGMAQRLAHVFAQDNVRFDRVKFMKACGF